MFLLYTSKENTYLESNEQMKKLKRNNCVSGWIKQNNEQIHYQRKQCPSGGYLDLASKFRYLHQRA
ncbi:hypothetical protein FMM74_021370 [Lachnospiraceae bacterium MD308]|nr:hypothetical protein [Lachnospiraceae bacterium MD308]